MSSAAEARLLRHWAECWREPAIVDRATWCGEHLRLPAETSALAGRYDLERYPFWREPLAAIDDPEVEKIVIMGSTQIGKTLFMQAVLASYALLSPVPAMLVAPDKDAIVDLRDRFYALCEASPILAPLVPPRQWWNNRALDLGRLRCHLAYAMNTQRLSGKACGLVLLTEVDRMRGRKEQGGPEKLAEERVKAFLRYKIIMESTPTDETSRIHAQYELSDQRRFLVPCPRCNAWQEFSFFPRTKGPHAGNGGIAGCTDKNGKWLAADACRELAYYRCLHGCRIEDRQKGEMIRAGRWVPRGQSIDKRGRLVGKPAKPPRIWGGRLSSLYAEHITFGRVAGEYVDSRDRVESLRSFMQNWLARIWVRKTKQPKWRELWARLRGGHQPGSVPPWALFLTAGVDVGETYTRWVLRAWGEGSTSALVDWGTTHSQAGKRTSHLEALETTLVARSWPLVAANPFGQTALVVRLTLIDVGYKPHLVHDWFRAIAGKGFGARVRQCVGVQDLRTGEPWRASVVERSARTGKVYEGGQERWSVNRARFNADLFSRWRVPAGEPGSWLLTSAPLRDCELYLRELTNEVPVRVEKKRGRDVTVWQPVDRNTGSHSWDAEVYAAAAADMITGGDWRELAKRYAPPAVRRTHEAEAPARFAAREHNEFEAR